MDEVTIQRWLRIDGTFLFSGGPLRGTLKLTSPKALDSAS